MKYYLVRGNLKVLCAEKKDKKFYLYTKQGENFVDWLGEFIEKLENGFKLFKGNGGWVKVRMEDFIDDLFLRDWKIRRV